MKEPFTVAIDGPAAAGKGTISRAIAAHFEFAHLDTGLLYRAVGSKFLIGADPIKAAHCLSPDTFDDKSLRGSEVAQAASKVATIPEVRAALLDFQRAFARRAGGAVLDGRDIATVVVPQSEVQLFITASPEVRARRRWSEMCERGDELPYDQVLKEVRLRDTRDTDRTTAPLKPGIQACIIDTTEMSVEDAVAIAISKVEAKR